MMSIDRDASARRVKAVKRNLFGTVDHEQIRDDLDRELKRISEEKKRKWNFDFENCQPLRGRYKWERVGKRLQTRKSPTEGISTCATESAENLCGQNNIVDTAHSNTRYNLRTREKEVENIQVNDFEPIKPPRKRLRELGATPAGNRNSRIAGHCEKQKNPKERRAKTAIVNSNERQSKPPRPLESKRVRR